MCGISGIAVWRASGLRSDLVPDVLATLFRLSERRGKEASGIALRTPERLAMLRMPMRASRMVRRADYQSLVQTAIADATRDDQLQAPFASIGHARLVTNGRFGIAANNQPVQTDGVAAVHNGIIVNDAALFAADRNLPRRSEVDSEFVTSFLSRRLAKGGELRTAIQELYAAIDGEANIAILFADRASMVLASNVGSLYFFANDGVLVYASEQPILEDLLQRSETAARLFAGAHIERLAAGEALLVDLDGAGPSRFSLTASSNPSTNLNGAAHRAVRVEDPLVEADARRRNLKRCTRCVLPQTMPGIRFDADGVCHYCGSYKHFPLKGLDALRAIADKHRRKDGRPDCIIGLSGGRDSSYGLHVLKHELGLNPIAYTFDWALVTDLARRNASRLCAKLGVEHVLVAADIQAKRRYIRQNVEAWAARPDLGMIPLFMAGDKMYFYHYGETARRYGIDLVVTCGNRFEMTDFKSGFAGVHTDMTGEGYRPYNVPAARKLKMVSYYAKNFAMNPRYLNSSLYDTASGFYASYMMKHELTRLFDYIPWDESVIDRTLRDEYGWEDAKDTESTWRIGDGTASFYNYIYYTLAGFTEHDTFRSHQIRAGVITRDQAMAYVERDNRPRFASMREYADTIGFDFDRVMAAIELAPRLY